MALQGRPKKRAKAMAYWASVRRPLPLAPGRIRSQSEAPVEAHTLILVRTKGSMVTSSDLLKVSGRDVTTTVAPAGGNDADAPAVIPAPRNGAA
jgi:hypothetical protein